ncbi:MAG: TIR domain-containing protein, partial [bacterium]|nr:TIR domain-containing protein [bacterium]
MSDKQHLNVFVSYAHDDKKVFDSFMEELKKNTKNSHSFNWKTWDNRAIPAGRKWHNIIPKQVRECDFAILLISSAFLTADYIEKDEFNNFLERSRKEGFLFFPVLLDPCDLSQWKELAARQLFLPKGIDYGKHWIKKLSYADLVEFAQPGNTVLPNPSRKRYMSALVKALDEAIRQLKAKAKKKKKEKEKNKYFKMVKPADELLPQDLLGPGKRAVATKDFYWRRKPDDIIKELLVKDQSLLIMGNPLAGKTRALYEALRKLENTTVIFPRERFVMEDDFKMPDTGTDKCIAVFDDIDLTMSLSSPQQLEKMILRLMDEGVTIAATCRRGNEFRLLESSISDKIREKLERVFINRLSDYQVKAFNDFLKKKKRKIKLDQKAFDRNIGSYFMNLTAMYDRYKDLDKLIKQYDISVPANLPKEILKALKYFYFTENAAGKSLYPMRKIKDFCERSLLGKGSKSKDKDSKERPKGKSKEKPKQSGSAWQMKLDNFASPKYKDEFSPGDWNNALGILSDSDYQLNFIQQEEPFIHIEDVYLERIVDGWMKLDRIVGILKKVYPGEDLQRHGFLTSIVCFNKLMGRARSSEDAERIFYKIKGLGMKPTTVTFNVLINKVGTFDEALNFLGKMKGHDLKPDAFTFNSLINKTESSKESLAFLDKMKEYDVKPDVVTFTSLINKAESSKEALAFLDKMKEQDVKPDEVTFTTLINKTNIFKEALAFLGKMKEQDVKPNDSTFTSLINKVNTFEEALSLLDKMKELDEKPNEVIFASLINKAKTLEESLTFLEKMQEFGVKPDEDTFNSLINKVNTYDESFSLVDKM